MPDALPKISPQPHWRRRTDGYALAGSAVLPAAAFQAAVSGVEGSPAGHSGKPQTRRRWCREVFGRQWQADFGGALWAPAAGLATCRHGPAGHQRR